jgi:hypothetical protein
LDSAGQRGQHTRKTVAYCEHQVVLSFNKRQMHLPLQLHISVTLLGSPLNSELRSKQLHIARPHTHLVP